MHDPTCHACPVACKKEVEITSGPYAGLRMESVEYEPAWSIGANCGIDDRTRTVIAALAWPAVIRPITPSVGLAATIVVSSTKAEPVVLPLVNVKKRRTVNASRSISATLAASPSGTATRCPRIDMPTGVTVLLVPNGICFWVDWLPS